MHNYGHWKKTLALLVMSALSLGASSVDAMPEGGVIRSGEGAGSQNGREMTIRQDSGRLAMDWTNFNVGKDETVRFQQPGKDALALNRVTGNQQSVIDGSLLSNGHVLLVNPNGVVIGKNASIDVGGLVASTAHVKDNFMKDFGNSTGAFTLGGVSDGKIINEGTINAESGLVALHAAKVENSGTITSNGGSVLMAAADTLTLTPDTDGKLNFTVDGKVAEASALNKGAITADGGTIVMTADSASDVMSTVVNNEGTLQARTLRKNEKGQILLEGNDKGQVEVSGTFDASGEGVGQDAGNIKVIGQKTIVHDGTNLLAKGDVNGGKIETSGDVLDLGDNLNIDAKGVNGKAGEWLLDPLDVIIADGDPTTTYDSTKYDIKKYETDGSLSSNTTIGYYDPVSKETADASATSTGITWIKTKTIKDLLDNGTDVTIQAAATNGVANITVNSPITKESGDEATLTMDAMRNIKINKDITSKSGKLNVFLNSDTNGNKVGAVIINANINTNGGNFTSTSGGNIVYTPKATSTTKGYDLGTLGKDSNVDSSKVTVGTYFGNVNDKFVADGSKADRSITTKGGSITLNGEVAIGLAGGTLNLDSTEKGADGNTVKDADGHSIGGSVIVTGIINSGNSYATYIYGTDAWNDLIKESGLVDKYLAAGTVPSYHYKAVNYVTNPDGTYKVDANGNYETTTEAKVIDGPHYTYSEANTEDPRWTGNGQGYSPTKGTGWTSVEVTGTSVEDSMTVKEFLTYYKIAAPDNFKAKYGSVDPIKDDNATIVAAIKANPTLLANLTADINDLLSVNWFVAKNLAQGGTKGGSTVGDTYLATLTTILENSLSAPESSTALFVGARGSGVLNKKGSTIEDRKLPYSYYGLPDDPLYSNGMYWVTGPEGKANDGKGTQFYSSVGSDWSKTYKDSKGNTTYNSGTDVYGFVNWSTWPAGGVTRTQPDNSGPFLTVGYGANSQWDDSSMAGGYGGAESAWAKGFVQEKNLANSSLKINSGNGEVKLQGDIGKAKALDTLNIESTGAVTIGTDNNNVTDYYHGTVYVDHGLYISGNGVTVGGEIHSGESEETDTSTTLGDKYKDSVTIESAGNIEVHGITSNTYDVPNTDGTTTTRGGKIKLTSTGAEGVITLGDGVDYNGKNTNGGVLKAASTAQGAVVIDAQGSNGGFENKTTADKAIDTNGTWQIYSASPDNDNFGDKNNLDSGTDAQWTSKSDSNTIATTNKYGKNPVPYSDASHNKFIFQATPVITLYVEDHEKTYGDDITDKLQSYLKSREEFTGLDGELRNVNDFTDAFQEKEYTKYISVPEGKNITVTSVGKDGVDGAVGTATRTNGKYEAADKQNAIYDLNVNPNGATAKAGYALNNENAKLEIKRKTLTINTDISQTYGNDTPTLVKLSKYQNQLVGKDTLSADDITYSISTTGDYAKSKGTNTTAHVRKDGYAGEYLTTGAIIKNGTDDVSANYEVTGSGTITVTPADLYLTVGDVSTTYGKAFNTGKYTYTIDTAKGGFVNGDTQASVLGDSFLNYTNTGAKTDASNENVKTQNAGTYELQGDASKDLSDYTVHITNGTSTVNKATLTVNPEDIHRIYGQAKEVQEDAKTAYNLSGFANGDTKDTVDATNKDGKTIDQLVTVTNDVSNALKDDGTHTQNASAAGYDMETAVSSDLTNYNIVVGDSKKVYLDKAALVVDTTGNTRTYGEVTNVSTDVANAASFHLAGGTNQTVNGDSYDDILKEMNLSTKSDALVTGDDGKVKTGNANTDPGYDIKAAFKNDLTNYTVTEGVVGKEKIEKADLTLTLKDVSTTYGQKFDEKTYGYKKDKSDLQGLTNGDDAKAITDVLRDSDFTYVNSGAKSDPNNENVKTQNAGSYKITGTTSKTLDNYNIMVNPGNSTVSKKAITVENEMNQIYGEKDSTTFSEIVLPDLANGDKLDTSKGSKFTISLSEDPNTPYNQNRKNRDTADVGEYADSLKYSGGGIVHNDGTDAYKNYDVTIKGIAKVHPKDIYTEVIGKGSTLSDVTWTKIEKDKLVNGDSWGNGFTFSVEPGDLISYADKTFGIKGYVNGHPISDGTQIGNYIYHPTGIVQLTFNPIVKPDVWAHSGGYRPRNKIETSLPVFRVEDAKVGQYGTYSVEHREDEDKLVLSATGMRLPEPDQVPDEERTFTTTLSTEEGSGTFKLEYNGVSLKVYPQDKKAEEVVRAGDKTKNVSLSEKALYVGYTEMGLDLIDLKGVYIYFN